MLDVRRRPLCIDLFCGKFGWGRAFADEGYRVIGFDIAHESYHGPVPPFCELVLQDIFTLHGAQLVEADVIVASSPCQEFSYRAMPWKRAKALGPPVLGINLFWQAWRIQQEIFEACGRYVPLVAENVKGAQKWVGRAAWHYGSFYLWGDVPALMPTTAKIRKVGMNFHEHAKTGQVQTGCNPDGRGIKNARNWWSNGAGTLSATTSSKSPARRAASAEIAKIPYPLARHIAVVFKPDHCVRIPAGSE
jgi:C-5 cytosine-specific DNA methylase